MEKAKHLLDIPATYDLTFRLTAASEAPDYFDAARTTPGLMAFGATMGEVHHDSRDNPNIHSPFVLKRTEYGDVMKIDLLSPKGQSALGQRGLATFLLKALTERRFVDILTSYTDSMSAFDDESVSEDEVNDYGFEKYVPQELQFATDGKGLAIWNSYPELNQFEPQEDEEVATERELGDYVRLLLPHASSSHEIMALALVANGFVKILNEIALDPDGRVALRFSQ